LPDQYLSLGSQLNAQVPNPYYNIAPAGTYLATQPTLAYNELLRPYTEYTYLQATRSLPGARSTFNALSVKYNHSFSAGLSLLTTYQWSKAMDNGPEDYFGWATGNSWRDAYNTMLDYNISTHDVPQSFVTALVYELPYGKGKTWGSNAPAAVRAVAGNWQVSTVVRLASGLPIGPVIDGYSNNLNNYGYPGPLLPDLLSTNVAPANRSPTNWINPGAYLDLNALINAGDTALMYQLGNAPERLTQLRERAERNIDLSVARNFGAEHYQVWLRGEALNLTNYAQYNNFCLDLTESSCGPFGQAYGTENNPRTIQLSLKFIY